MPLADDEIAPVYSVLIGAVSKAGVCVAMLARLATLPLHENACTPVLLLYPLCATMYHNFPTTTWISAGAAKSAAEAAAKRDAAVAARDS